MVLREATQFTLRSTSPVVHVRTTTTDGLLHHPNPRSTPWVPSGQPVILDLTHARKHPINADSCVLCSQLATEASKHYRGCMYHIVFSFRRRPKTENNVRFQFPERTTMAFPQQCVTLLVLLLAASSATPIASAAPGFCSWNDCYSTATTTQQQGGAFCQTDRQHCETDCKARWCEGEPLPANNVTHYCSWVGCNGQRQGGEQCNHNQATCLGCGNNSNNGNSGAQWCAFADDDNTNTNNKYEYYCNWEQCNGVRQGGDFCNERQERCLGSCGTGAQWCPNSTTTTTTSSSHVPPPPPTTGEHVPATPVEATPTVPVGGGVESAASTTSSTTGVQPTMPTGERVSSSSSSSSPSSPYCSWTGCFGEPQGGDFCNDSPEQCLSCGTGATWCDATPSPPNGYCNWSVPRCNGIPEGGDYCNQSVERCLACGQGAVWCKTATDAVAEAAAPLSHPISHSTLQKRIDEDVAVEGLLRSSGRRWEKVMWWWIVVGSVGVLVF